MNPLPAVVAIAIFYGVFLAIGVWAGRRGGDSGGGESSDRDSDAQNLLVANRRLPLIVGIATMTATWVGGGYIVATAEAVYDPQRGLLWTQAPWCYAVSLVLGGLFFAKRMHRGGFTTLLDVFDRRYGKRTAAVLYLPALCGELFWAAAILMALGATMSTVLGLPIVPSVIVSAIVVICYTLFGGLWAVAYTDVLQLACILVGLGVALFYASDGFSTLSESWTVYQETYADSARWCPSVAAFASGERWVWQWCDFALLLVLGGIPWQVYFQRVLACETSRQATMLSVVAGLGCLCLAVPSVLIGMVGASTDWSQTAVEQAPSAEMVLPYVLRYLTPSGVAIVGLAAIAAAVMSSVDSSLLSAGSMFTWNVYRTLIRPSASDQSLRSVLRYSVVVIGALATVMAIQVQSVYALWYLCAELVYVVLFPQLLLALYVRRVNGIGALVGAAAGLLIRISAGEPTMSLPAMIAYPWPDGAGGTMFPIRTFAMLCGLVVTLVASQLTLRRMPPKQLYLQSN